MQEGDKICPASRTMVGFVPRYILPTPTKAHHTRGDQHPNFSMFIFASASSGPLTQRMISHANCLFRQSFARGPEDNFG